MAITHIQNHLTLFETSGTKCENPCMDISELAVWNNPEFSLVMLSGYSQAIYSAKIVLRNMCPELYFYMLFILFYFLFFYCWINVGNPLYTWQCYNQASVCNYSDHTSSILRKCFLLHIGLHMNSLHQRLTSSHICLWSGIGPMVQPYCHRVSIATQPVRFRSTAKTETKIGQC